MNLIRPALAACILTLAASSAWSADKKSDKKATKNVAAAETLATIPGVDSGKLLPLNELEKWGFGTRAAAPPVHRDMETAKLNTPGDLHTDICDLSNDGAKTTPAKAFIVVESFDDGITEESVAVWLQDMEAKNKAMDAKVKAAAKDSNSDHTEEFKLGNATCESGHYPVVTKQGDAPATMHYVACDQQVASRHVAINLEWPGDEPVLPTVEETKALLDTAVAAMPPAH